LHDTRERHWPPTNDRRQLWLFRYRYQPSQPEDGSESDDLEDDAVGMVGSITMALFGEPTAELPPEDVYALHCCWELESNNDSRAPCRRSVKAGRKILADHDWLECR
jgi:hypothetical protein